MRRTASEHLDGVRKDKQDMEDLLRVQQEALLSWYCCEICQAPRVRIRTRGAAGGGDWGGDRCCGAERIRLV